METRGGDVTKTNADMSVSLSAERDRIQRQVEEIQQKLSVDPTELDLLSSETDDVSDSEDEQDEVGQCAASLLVQKKKIQTAIQNLEDMLGPHSPLSVSSRDSSSSDESDLGLSESVDSCLQVNLVYQQVIQETLDQLEMLLTHNQSQQRDILTQISGPIEFRERPTSSLQYPPRMFLGSFLKPYFKDKLTGLGPPANQEARLRAQRMAGCPHEKKLRTKRWESWHKILLIHSVSRDSLKRLVQPKLSRVGYLTLKMSTAKEEDQLQLRKQIEAVEKEVDLLRQKKEDEMIGSRYDEHDWEKISNIDFEGTKDAEDIRLFWQNFLHPSINKTAWSKEEVQQLKEVSRRHQERHWERIAEELETGRTAFMCLQMFQRFVSKSLRHSCWTPEEDSLFRELVEKMRIGNYIPYTQISYFMEGRDPGQLLSRWIQVLDPSLKKGPWTREEDQLLLKAVSRHGEKCWWKIRLEVPGRSDSSCRDRYLDCLRKDIKRGSFTKPERELLKTLVVKHGIGRWAKIAAEIPHRLDAQCMREWRRISCPTQYYNRRKQTRREGGMKRTKTSKAQRKIRRFVRIKKEEEEDVKEGMGISEEEQDDVDMELGSDEDRKKKKRKLMRETIEEEEEEEEYVIPPMEEWIPAETSGTVSSLNFQPAVLSSPSSSPDRKCVRSTVVEKSGNSVVFGAPPRELRCEERHNSAAMMMVTCHQLRTYLNLMEQKSTALPPRRKPVDRSMGWTLLAAVTPWIGNLLIKERRRRMVADVHREKLESSNISTSSAFLLFIQAMNVDVVGCKEMILQRKKRVVHQAPPPAPSLVRNNNRRKTARLLLPEAQQQRPQPCVLLQVPRHPTPQVFLLPPPTSQPVFTNIRPRPAPPFISTQPTTTPVLIPLAPPPPQAFPIGSAVTSDCTILPSSSTSSAAPSPALTPPTWRAQREEATCSSQSMAAGTDVGGAQREAQPKAMRASSSPEMDLTQKTSSAPHPPASSSSDYSLSLAPPTSIIAMDHNYIAVDKAPDGSDAAPTGQSTGMKRKEEEQQEEAGSSGPGVTPDGKRLRKPSLKVREATAQVAAKKRSSASSAQPKQTSKTHGKQATPPLQQTLPLPQIARLNVLPKQTMWVMTSAGLVPLAPPPHMQLMSVPSSLPPAPQAPPPPTAGSLPSVRLPPPAAPRDPVFNLPHPFNATPTSQLMPIPRSHDLNRCQPNLPQPDLIFPYKGVIKVDSVKAPPLRTESVQFNPALMFREPTEEVCGWLSGHGGVAVPGARTALPYLPPLCSTLSMFRNLLCTKKALMTSSLQLLKGANDPDSAHSAADLPDSTTDVGAAEDQPAPIISPSQEEEEEQQVEMLRQMVVERYSSNPAYQLLKARFLAFFTLPALLATMQPITKDQGEEEEEEEEEEDDEQLKKIQERGRKRRAERSLLLSDDITASANTFSATTDPERAPQNQPAEPGLDQTGSEQELSCGLSGSTSETS